MKRKFLALVVAGLAAVSALIIPSSPAEAYAPIVARKRVCYTANGQLAWAIRVAYINTSANKYRTLTGPNRTAHGDPMSATGQYIGDAYTAAWTTPGPNNWVDYSIVLPIGSAEPSYVLFWRPINSDANPVPYQYDILWFTPNEPLRSCDDYSWTITV